MFKRFRHRRQDEETRRHYRETILSPTDFIMPVFIVEGTNHKSEILSLPEVYHYSVDRLIPDLEELIKLGLHSILIFGVPSTKGIDQSCDPDGVVQKALPAIKKAFPSLEIITDVCLCAYTDTGHCHIGDNDLTCTILAKIAVSHAQAGADIVAPSDMMDGRVHYINQALKENNLRQVRIMSYAAKYASNFYGPFRDATDCAPQEGDRRGYQMDYSNSDEAMEEIEADIAEGTDIIMIKPALSYLDIIARARQHFDLPIIAYNVSGEYVLLKQAVQSGVAREDIIWEALTSIKRAGAQRIVSYFTPYVLAGLKKQ